MGKGLRLVARVLSFSGWCEGGRIVEREEEVEAESSCKVKQVQRTKETEADFVSAAGTASGGAPHTGSQSNASHFPFKPNTCT